MNGQEMFRIHQAFRHILGKLQEAAAQNLFSMKPAAFLFPQRLTDAKGRRDTNIPNGKSLMQHEINHINVIIKIVPCQFRQLFIYLGNTEEIVQRS